jgi:hypothetical protein
MNQEININFKNYSTKILKLAITETLKANKIYGEKDKKGLIRELKKIELIKEEIIKREKTKYRILTDKNLYQESGITKIYGTGSNIGSWFTLKKAQKIVNQNKNFTIIEICNTTGDILWEIL